MLKPKKRITRKEIKQDKLVTVYFKVNDWIGENSKIVFGGLIAIVVVAALAMLFSSQQRANEEKASVDLAMAERMFEVGQYRDAIDVLNILVESYGGTKSGRIGKFFLATAHYNLKEYEFGESNFRKFLSKGVKDPLMCSSAMSGIAACLEQQGNFAEAAIQYKKAAEKYPEEIIVSSALFNSARCYIQAEQNQTAKTLFKKIIADYPDSDEAEKAKVQLAMLEQKDTDAKVINIEP